ncbi:glycosyltransferase involved in cell wall biosynthesis [Salinibacter ruber]|uniref:glycosyltransferase family 4 protein n=1 Tax=Salinibacter ruber TaxID=146919 RepID=UPI00216979C2|nr:glycosyltransferase family 4 protein [Salinibacter ruber]MCS3657973.1 glycosyltransferase involved in cell wall biosynthesis [Salinibacter ruber]MCS4169870.1 glycosyltransferase involved in cell wall biosynthesis [Salinibacter ruber]
MKGRDNLRLLFVCGGSYVSGAEIVELSVMRGLQVRGHAVRCVTNAWNDGEFHKRLDETGIPYQAIPLGMVSKTLKWKYIKYTLDALIHLPKTWYDYQQEVRRFQPDLIVHTSFGAASLLRPFARPEKTLFHVHGMPGESLHFRHVMRSDYRGYVAVSNAVGRALEEKGIPDEKVHVVQNGIELDAGSEANAKEDEGNSHVRIGIVGQIGAWKGHDDLIEALHLLQDRGRSFVCDIVGSGNDEYLEALKAKIEQLGLQKRVRWRGFVKDTAAIYAPLDICVVPSRFPEPFGLVAVEAARAGLPVVASERGGLSEIVVDGKTGFLVEEEHPEQLADRLEQLLDDHELRHEMGRQGKARVRERFTRERMVDEMEEVLAKVSR